MSKFDRKNNKYIPPSSRGPVKKNVVTSNKIDMSTEMFPELLSSGPRQISNISINTNKAMSKSVWSPPEPKNDDEDENKSNDIAITDIDVQNSKYWKGVNWTGPVIIRGNTKPSAKSDETNRSRIEYSRDNIHWYSSFEKTFSENILERQKIENEEKDCEEHREHVCRILNEYSRRLEEETERYYHDFGELDDYGKAVLAREQYEEYAQQFEITNEIDSCEENNDYDDDEEGYLEEE